MARPTFDVPPTLRRVVAQHAAAWLVGAVARVAVGAVAAVSLYAPAALAQEAGAPIVIPGPGEQNPADLARMTAMATSSNSSSPRTVNPQLATTLAPSAPSSALQVTDRFAALANASGAIVIPGTGEASAPGAPNVAANTTVIQQRNPANTAGLTRVNMNPALAASQVVPVVVTSAPARATYGAALRPVNVAPAAAPAAPTAGSAGVATATPAAAPASGIEIDSLASRGEPPELGPSAPSRAPAPRIAAAPAQASLPAQSKAQLLAEATQREQAIKALQQAQAKALQRAQVPQAAATPAVQASQPIQPQAQVQAAQPVPAGQEDGALIHAAALDFLKQQANGLPGQVELSVAPAFPRGLAACDTLQAFMPPGARMWGHTTVGVRCAGSHPWTVWLQAKVSIHATYYVAARAMNPGEVISETDLVAHDGDLTMLPTSIVTVPSQAVGSVTLMRVSAGFPLRQDMLKSAAEVTAGQEVRVVAQGDGFSISSEGAALSSATPGQQVRVKTSTGQILMGTVKDSSTVQIQM